MVHIYHGILLNHKKDKIMPFAATEIKSEILILCEVWQKEKDRYHMISPICGIQNMTQMILSTKKKQITDRESRLVPGGGRGSVKDGEFGVGGCKLLHWEWISNEVLCTAQGNMSSVLV